MFCGRFKVAIEDLVTFTLEDGFMDGVVKNLDYAKGSTAEVLAAVKRRALADGPEAMVWTIAFLRIVEHPAADDLEDLIPGRSNGTTGHRR